MVLATPRDAVAEWAWNAGRECPLQAWMLHDWDVWVANPHYTGPPVPHPEYEADGLLGRSPEAHDPDNGGDATAQEPPDLDDIPF